MFFFSLSLLLLLLFGVFNAIWKFSSKKIKVNNDSSIEQSHFFFYLKYTKTPYIHISILNCMWHVNEWVVKSSLDLNAVHAIQIVIFEKFTLKPIPMNLSRHFVSTGWWKKNTHFTLRDNFVCRLDALIFIYSWKSKKKNLTNLNVMSCFTKGASKKGLHMKTTA